MDPKPKKKFLAGQAYHRPEALKIHSPQASLNKNFSINHLLKSSSSTKGSPKISSPKVLSSANTIFRINKNFAIQHSPSLHLKLDSLSSKSSTFSKKSTFPMLPKQVLTNFSEDLHKLEKVEIQEYQLIYFLGSKNRIKPYIDGENNGYDHNGDYIVVPGDHIAFRYEILKLIGQGSFGQVVECYDYKRNEKVAVKIIKNKKRFHQQAMTEIKILQQLRENDLENKYNVVKIKNYFQFRQHICICFELLSINLFELQKQNEFEGLSITLIHRFTVQLLVCLQYLSSQKIIHCDLKPENILLKDTEKALISIIDFGTSCFENEKLYSYVQSRFYRAPEVILGNLYTTAIDMWSLGCILVELVIGKPLFVGDCEHDQLLCIIEVLGTPPRSMLSKATKRDLFFDSQLQPQMVGLTKKEGVVKVNTRPLRCILEGCSEEFIEFVQKCLTWVPQERLKPLEGLDQPWIRNGLKRCQI